MCRWPSADLTLCLLHREEEIVGLDRPWRDAEATLLLLNPVLGFLISLPYNFNQSRKSPTSRNDLFLTPWI